MEIQLQELIAKIKEDGVSAAEEKAEAIISSAQAEAEKIIADAKADAEKIMLTAKAENERLVSSSEDAIRQAGRNLLISFRESVALELKAVTGETVRAVYKSEDLAKLIVAVVENWANKPDTEELTVILNENDLKELEEGLLAALKSKLTKGVELKANDNFDGGFRIAVNNDGAYYDYSEEAVVGMLSNYLSPKVQKLLKEA